MHPVRARGGQASRPAGGRRREARERGEDSLGVERLLLALLSDSRNGAVQTLEELKTTSEAIRRRLDRPRVTDARAGLPPDLAGAEVQVTSRRRPLSTS
ncbi:MAG TPA: Clp protease N-terminal domain-containing protein [Solirubrobacteraceae bacterium]|nr:Clp protease N-terminal domain-containing protein [Solirubrobacteraceae bacterium]